MDLHFRLAEALVDRSPDEAKRHVLQALEDAPRFRAAQKLLAGLANPEPKELNPEEEAKGE